jgi:Glycosyl hydrolases family 2, TIM barrel domain/Glycosyl hydrolases family 2, sugar binding domain/Glycosyl hydrolases family 2/Beta galactosidase small chain
MRNVSHHRPSATLLALLAALAALRTESISCAQTLPNSPTETTTTTQTLYLSGHDKDDAVPWSFSCNSGNHATPPNPPSTLPVPSNWELHGFGTFTYGTELRPQKNKPPIPITPVLGHYSTTFTPPADWASRRTFLVFEGVMSDASPSLNGKSVGPTHQGGYTRFSYDVSSLLRPGQPNTLDVLVSDESANPSVNNAERRGDYFNYAGIYRPVYLQSVPQSYIWDVAINATADGNFAAKVRAVVPIESLDHQKRPEFLEAADEAAYDAKLRREAYQMQTDILDAAGKTVGTSTMPCGGISAAGQTATLYWDPSLSLDHPKLWTAETPNLYTVQLSLKQNNQVLHTITQRFGFRTIEIKNGDGLYVNGKRILLKGSDRHSFWPDSGRCLSEKISRNDIALMHQMNMNAVRMSHYPPDPHFLDAADDMGLYVLDELSGWHGHYDDEVGHKLVTEMVTRDVNHPCILFWDNGNESGWNTHLDADFPALDPQKRHVLHPWALNDGIDTKHYPDYATLLAKANGDNLYFPTEMLHGLYDGGAGAGLADYWDVIRHGKAAAGGFIWAFLDEAPKRVDLDGHLDTRGNQAPDGIVGPYREKEGSFYTIKQLWSPVVITNKELPADGQFTIENRYDFTNLKDCKFSYQLRKFPSPADNATGFKILAEGPIASPDIVPGATGKLHFNFPPTTQPAEPADALAIRIENPAGQELFTPVFALPHSHDTADITKQPTFANGITSVSETADVLTITGVNGLRLTFDKTTGLLATVANAGKAFSLTNGPRLVIGDATLVSLKGEQAKNGDILATVTATYTGNMKSVTWSIHSNGWIDLSADYHLTGPHDFIGIGFDYPEKNIKSLRWLGDGPYRVYANRLAGPTLSVWQNDYNDSITGSIPWKYPEFKGYFDNIHWAQYQTTEGPITFLVPNNLFLQNFTPTQPSQSLGGKTIVPYPPTSIGFLHAIPPIGTKFSSPTPMGPRSEQPIAEGDYRTQVSLYFGELPAPGK